MSRQGIAWSISGPSTIHESATKQGLGIGGVVDESAVVNITISGALGTVTLSGLAASLNLQTAVAGTLGTVTWTGQTATLGNTIAVNGTVGAVTLTGQAATVAMTVFVNAAVGTATWTGQSASLDVPLLAGRHFQDGNVNTPISSDWLNGVNDTLYQKFSMQTGAAYTTAITDLYKVITFTNANPVLVTIPQSGTITYPLNTILKFSQLGAGQVTLQGAAGVTLLNVDGHYSTKGQYGILYAQQTGHMDTWIVWGDSAATAAVFTNPGPVVPVNPPVDAPGGGVSTPVAVTSSPSSVSLAGLAASIALSVNTPPDPVTPPSNGSTITTMKFQELSGLNTTNIPVTFGHVFTRGQMPAASAWVALQQPDTSMITCDFNIMATHDDGSVRHAIISAILPSLNSNETRTMNLQKVAAVTQNPAAVPGDFTSHGLDSVVSITDSGVAYTASLATLLTGTYTTWITGNIANEWLVKAPLVSGGGVTHPHIHARFAVRPYTGTLRARIEVVLENSWAYDTQTTNPVYNLSISVAGTNVFTQSNITHYQFTRFKKTFWWGAQPQVHIAHNTAYLIGTRAVPNYDQTVVPSNSAIQAFLTRVQAANPIGGNGLALASMPTTGGRPEIGLMPAWDTLYLLKQDLNSKQTCLLQADLAGNWDTIYRDINTDLPLSLAQYPYATILGQQGDSWNPVAKRYEKLPTPPSGNPLHWESSHHPDMFYMAYLVTGNYFYLENLQFNATRCLFESNPGSLYRNGSSGWLTWNQVRGQAWAMRSIGRAGYITPDSHGLKSYFNTMTANNLDHYRTLYTDNTSANALHFIETQYGYTNSLGETTGIAPWMDDFFTSAIGHLAELRFAEAVRLVYWKARYPILRLTSGSDYCWLYASIYAMFVKDHATSPYYTTMKQCWQASVNAATQATSCNSPEMLAQTKITYGDNTYILGQMVGYSQQPDGFPSNMQPAVAAASDSGAPLGTDSWTVFSNRSVKPDYSGQPQFAIVPRN